MLDKPRKVYFAIFLFFNLLIIAGLPFMAIDITIKLLFMGAFVSMLVVGIVIYIIVRRKL